MYEWTNRSGWTEHVVVFSKLGTWQISSYSIYSQSSDIKPADEFLTQSKGELKLEADISLSGDIFFCFCECSIREITA